MQLARHLIALTLPRLEGCEALRLVAELGSESHRDGIVDDLNDLVVVFSKMEEESSVGRATLVLGCASSLKSDVAKELEFVLNANELETLFDGALDALTVGADIAKQGSKFTSLEDELGESLVAKLALGLAESALQVGVKADESQVVYGGSRVGGAEVASVQTNHTAKSDLRLLASCVREEVIAAADVAMTASGQILHVYLFPLPFFLPVDCVGFRISSSSSKETHAPSGRTTDCDA